MGHSGGIIGENTGPVSSRLAGRRTRSRCPQPELRQTKSILSGGVLEQVPCFSIDDSGGGLISVIAMMRGGPVEKQTGEPVTLHRILQKMIGEGLREHYKPPQKLSHELFVLLMQMKEQERRDVAAAANGGPSRS
jgi:hypothetical protein